MSTAYSLSKARLAIMRSGILFGLITVGWPAGSAHASPPMLTGSLTSQPIGHYEFCKANSTECTIRTRDLGPQHVTGTVWRKIIAINTRINRSVRPITDIDAYGRDEVWAYPNGHGDCEDYVLEKRRDLMREGLSPSNLLITVVRKRGGQGHAVLTVRTDKGDFILDNLTDAIRHWDQTGYDFLKRQSSDHPGSWVTIGERRNPIVSTLVVTPVAKQPSVFDPRVGKTIVRPTKR
ncbi:transglutaminase-like cysteine peptidase [Mesorhizobium escarrei]|uniref:Predicted transglutaminase-like cysteine proteinase n=1 Tax=Mesorhizobium escarrei TaxID=666018 RepID=A0ABN8JGX8_9HYPH|nr:transglutaminase-like cysteine peptidase [Mesorhizobium escarrei]CAH2396781.1 Predicted transglutaminase-like cysteine proteinase [Mesorhizobium escarrei]